MRTSMYDIIKRQNGEAFAQGIRRFDNGLFEVPNLDKIVRYAGRNPVPILGFLESFKNIEIDETVEYKDPFLLLKSVGYDAFVADTLDKQNSIASYFDQGEELCTFDDWSRFKNYHIIHCVKKGADKLKRSDFKEPRREDEYGTSVISIQILKTGGYISIKNRYNHSVESPDNTFSSNPDNIVKGLSFALKKYFNVDFVATKASIPNGYTYQNEQIYRYYYEKNNAYYGEDFCLYNGICYPINKDYQIFIGPYLLDMKEKKIVTDFPTKDFFGSLDMDSISLLNNELKGKKIHIQLKGDKKHIFVEDEEFAVIHNKQVISLSFNEANFLNLAWLKDFKFLATVSAPNATSVHFDVSKNPFLKRATFLNAEEILMYTTTPNYRLEKVKAPKVQNLKILTPEFFLNVEDINTPNMNNKGQYTVAGMTIDVNQKECLGASSGSLGFKELLNDELRQSQKVDVVLNGKNKEVYADDVLILKTNGSKLTKIHLEKCTVIPEFALVGFPKVEEISIPNAIIMQDSNVCNCPNLVRVDFSSLMYIDNECFNYNDKLEKLILNNVQEMGSNCITTNASLQQLEMISLLKLAEKNILNNRLLKKVELENLEDIGLFCFNWLPELERFDASKVVKISPCCFQNSPKMTTFNAPELLYLGDRCFNYPEFKSLYAPKLQERWKKDYLPLLTQTPSGPQLICSGNHRFQFSQKAHERADD